MNIKPTILNIKPLSVNEAWKGRRFKTKDYEQYERDVGFLLPHEIVVTQKLELHFGFSSKASDIDNPVKPILDILQKKYGFDDKHITELRIRKSTVSKGEEFVAFYFY